MRTFLALLVAVSMAACSAPSKDAAPAAKPVAAPQRIVTLHSVLTEVVSALGLEDHIVGTDVTSKYPGAVNALPKLGHDKAIRAEGILSLSPDLVMANAGQLDPAVEGQLRQAGVRLMLFTPENSIDGAKQLIAEIADSLARSEDAKVIAARIDSDRAAVVPLDPSPKVLFIYARGAGTLLVAGEGTPIQSMITLAGGTNAVTGFTDFKPLTPEALVAADPDVVLLFNTGADDLQGHDALMRVPGMASTNAGRNGSFIRLDPVIMAGFGPRVGQAVAQLNADLARYVKK
jgi:iron complex transport system substrate-binding protein